MKIDAGRLFESLPSYIHPLIYNLLESNYQVYLVGGVPRDILMHRNPEDVDFAVKSSLKTIAKLIENTFSIEKKITTRFLTLNYILKNGYSINIAHFRKEQYPEPASLPIVEPAYTIEEDARRRDFTVNSIYIDIYNLRFIDPLNGISDIKNNVLKITYKGSFRDDPTRIFRAIRYKNRLCLTYEQVTLEELREGVKYIKLLTKERIINELKRIAEESNRIKTVEELARFSIINIKINEDTMKILRKIDNVIPYNKNSWIFIFYPVLRENLLKWPITRKERKIIELLADSRTKRTSLINSLRVEYPYIDKVLNLIHNQ